LAPVLRLPHLVEVGEGLHLLAGAAALHVVHGEEVLVHEAGSMSRAMVPGS
jgi:hypothetical protein